MPTQTSTCPECGAALRGRWTRGLCPRCVLRITLADEPEDNSPSANEGQQRFGDYELMRELGRGGMGVVYEARQLSLHRTVALKMLLPSRLASAPELERFRLEAEAIAALDHPNILPVYEVGSAQGQPYFTMKLAEGGSLAMAERGTRNEKSRVSHHASLVAHISRAVHYAHQRGIQHRDLKPGNILLDAEGRPYVSDFGLAKFLDRDSSLTLSNAVLGSPAYMAPEQAAGDTKKITTAADIYSLGAILYELLAGHPPFQGATALDTMRRVMEDEPLRAPIQNVERDLQVICLKALNKEPAQRYTSAEALAEDLERWLAGDPILARPISSAERFARWCRRKPAIAALLALLVFAVAGGVVGISVQWRRAEEHSRHREVERYAADLQVASQALASRDLGLARRMLAAQTPAPGEQDLRGFEWHLLQQLCQGQHTAALTGHTATVTCVALSPDGTMAASGGMDATVTLWNLQTQTIVTKLRTHNGVVWSVCFTPDSERIISAGADRKVRFWTRDGRPAEEPIDGQNAALSGDGTRLATSMSSPFRYFGAERGVKVRERRTGRLLFETNASLRRVALSADGRWLAAGGAKRDIFLWNIDTGESRRIATADTPWSLTFSPDSSRLAAAGFSLGARIWSLRDEASPPLVIGGHQFSIWDVAFSPDGQRVVTSGSDRTLQIRSLDAPDRTDVLVGHEDEIWAVAWSRDSATLATSSKDMTVRLWPARSVAETAGWPCRDYWIPQFSSDGRRLLTLNDASTRGSKIALRDTQSGVLVTEFDNRWVSAFGTNGEDVVLWNDETTRLETWQSATSKVVPGPPLERAPGATAKLFSVSADGKALALAYPAEVWIWNTADGKRKATVPLPKGFPILALALSPRADHLAITATAPYTIWLHDLRSGHALTLTNHTEEVKGLAFSLDGELLASAGVDRVIRLWDTRDGHLKGELVRYFEEASGVAFSPDGRLLASIGASQSVNLWHLPTQREVMSLSMPQATQRIAFSPTGDAIAFTADTNVVRVLSVEHGGKAAR